MPQSKLEPKSQSKSEPESQPGSPAISPVLKRSLSISGHSTSVSLEEPFWAGLKEIAGSRSLTVAALVREIDAGRGTANLSSALRVTVLAHYRDRVQAP